MYTFLSHSLAFFFFFLSHSVVLGQYLGRGYSSLTVSVLSFSKLPQAITHLGCCQFRIYFTCLMFSGICWNLRCMKKVLMFCSWKNQSISTYLFRVPELKGHHFMAILPEYHDIKPKNRIGRLKIEWGKNWFTAWYLKVFSSSVECYLAITQSC